MISYSPTNLEECSAALARERPAFVVQLGDLVDGGLDNLNRILPLWEKAPGPRYSVLGNHDHVAARAVLAAKLKMPGAWYDFSLPGWHFVVLDGMEVSAGRGGDERLAALKRDGASNAQSWNGALGDRQREWLRRTLAGARRQRQRAIVFCHFPTLAAACRPEHLLWDHAETVALLESQPAVAAWMNGHDHRGGYASRNGIHYVTFAGMVEHDAVPACRVVDVYPDRLVVRTAGQKEGQTLPLRR